MCTNYHRWFLCRLFYLFALWKVSQCTGILGETKIYSNLYSENICFRRFNKTHQTGCQSSILGNVGTLHLIEEDDDLELVLNSGQNSPYIPCLSSNRFDVDLFQKFEASKRISGVFILHHKDAEHPKNGFSADSSCPDTTLELYRDTKYAQCSQQVWNNVTGPLSLMSLDLQFPVFLIQDPNNITEITNCFKKFNEGKDSTYGYKCSAELQSRMSGAKDSVTCMSRTIRESNSISGGVKFCDPLGSLNVFATYKEQTETNVKNNSLLILAARLDSLSFFDMASMGADSTLTGVIAVLAIADTLQKFKKVISENDTVLQNDYPNNILYSFFDGEAFDYIGSGRTAYDFLHNGLEHFDIIKGRELYNKPIYKAANIHSILELNQLAMYGPNSPYYLHADPISIENESLALKIANMKKDIMNSFRGDSISILDTPETLPLPPSSVQTFLKHKIDVPALVLSNHNGEYQNKFYNSFWDNSKQVGYTSNPKNFVSKMTTLVSYLSNSVLKIIQSQQEQQLQADADLVRTISECFFVNISCDFFTYIRGHESTVATAHQTFYPLYISVAYPSITSAHFEFVRVIERLLAFVTGEPIPNVRTKEECEKLQGTYDYVTFEWYDQLNGTRTWDSVCKRTTRFTTKAMSPVFERKDEPDWNLNYSTWTESVWTVPTARIFIAPTRYQEYSTLAAGLGVLIVSITIITFLNRNSDLIFLGLRRAGTESSASC